MWVACCIIKQHRGKEIDDAACGLHTALLSPSLSPFPLLPTLLSLLQPSHLVVVAFHVVAGAGNMGAAAERWWWGVAWDCWCQQACPRLANLWALARALDGSSGWLHSGSGVRKEVDIVVLATWCRSLKWLCTFSTFEHQIDCENFETSCLKKEPVHSFLNWIAWKKCRIYRSCSTLQ